MWWSCICSRMLKTLILLSVLVTAICGKSVPLPKPMSEEMIYWLISIYKRFYCTALFSFCCRFLQDTARKQRVWNWEACSGWWTKSVRVNHFQAAAVIFFIHFILQRRSAITFRIFLPDARFKHNTQSAAKFFIIHAHVDNIYIIINKANNFLLQKWHFVFMKFAKFHDI